MIYQASWIHPDEVNEGWNWKLLTESSDHREILDELESPSAILPEGALLTAYHNPTGETCNFCVVVEGQTRQVSPPDQFLDPFLDPWDIDDGTYWNYANSLNWYAFWRCLVSADRFRVAWKCGVSFTKLSQICYELCRKHVNISKYENEKRLFEVVQKVHDEKPIPHIEDFHRSVALVGDDRIRSLKRAMQHFVSASAARDRMKIKACFTLLCRLSLTEKNLAKIINKHIRLADVLAPISRELVK